MALRRPRRMRQLTRRRRAATPEARQRIDAIVRDVRAPRARNSFLMLSAVALAAETVADITHESLIAQWKRLETWLRAESRSARWYADLARDVARYRTEAGNQRVAGSSWPASCGAASDDGWARRGRTGIAVRAIRRSRSQSFLDESTRQQASGAREAQELRDQGAAPGAGRLPSAPS